MLDRLGQRCARHHRVVLLIWVIVLAGAWTAGLTFGRSARNTFTLPGAQSQEALDLLEEDFPAAAGTSATVVYHTTNSDVTVDDSSVKTNIEAAVKAIESLADISLVSSPYNKAAAISSDKRTAISNVLYSKPISELEDNGGDAFDELEDTVTKSESSQLEIELGGSLPGLQPVGLSDILVLYGLIAALVVLLLALSTWWSFAWPVLGALVGVALGNAFVLILQRFVDVPAISTTAAVMIGLGVGIDYGLFVVGRFKESLAGGASPTDAAGEAISSAGRAVLTAASTVIVALLALLVFQVPAVTAMAYTVVIVVVSVVLVVITFLPAILGLVGRRVITRELPWERKPGDQRTTLGMRWASFVTRFAKLTFPLGVIILIVLAIPVLAGDLRLGPMDNSLYPPESTQYEAWDLQTKAFGAGSTDPFLIVVEVPSDDSDALSQIDKLRDDVKQTSGVASVTPAVPNSSKSLRVFEVSPTTDAQDAATADLVSMLRDDTIPKALEGTDLTALVSGTNAVFVDLDDRIASRLILFVLLVVVIAFVILSTVFRSLLIPLKAAFFNIITILATYGVLVAVFTWGWGRSWIGVPENIPILSLLAPVIFAVLFGLSNDYEVYFVSRMREEWQQSGDAKRAARLGHARGSRVVIAAALVMAIVFVSYVFQPGTAVKEFGFGMAAAIMIDAFVTRMLMLPSLMYLGGKAMWWFPGSRDRGKSPSPVS